MNIVRHGTFDVKLFEAANLFMRYKVQTTCYILNEVSTNAALKNLYELWHGRKPSLNHLRILGCPTYVLDKNARKLDSQIELCMFVGYTKEAKGGLFYNLKEKIFIVSTHATFLEEIFMNDFKRQSKEILEELSGNIQNYNETVPEPTLNSRLAND